MWRRSSAIGRYGGMVVQVEDLRDGMKEPFRILLTCYQVLKTKGDPQADSILEDIYNLLGTCAAKISDEYLRDCFLNNVTVNREIVEADEKNSLGTLKT